MRLHVLGEIAGGAMDVQGKKWIRTTLQDGAVPSQVGRCVCFALHVTGLMMMATIAIMRGNNQSIDSMV